MVQRIVAAILIAAGLAACGPYDYPYEGGGYYSERPRPRRVCDADGCWYPVPKKRVYRERYYDDDYGYRGRYSRYYRD
jgi:hypothetical protein